MADASTTTTAPEPVQEIAPQIAPPAEAPTKDVSGEVQVLFEQVDGVLKKIKDVEEHSLTSYKTAYDAAVATLGTLQQAASGAKDDAVKDVYGRAVAKAQELVSELAASGQEASLAVAKLQGELQALVDEIKLLDPNNPLVGRL